MVSLFTGFDWDVLAEAKSQVAQKAKGLGKVQGAAPQSSGSGPDYGEHQRNGAKGGGHSGSGKGNGSRRPQTPKRNGGKGAARSRSPRRTNWKGAAVPVAV